jgi:5-methylcytosine-specific restriction endonuclease McrA
VYDSEDVRESDVLDLWALDLRRCTTCGQVQGLGEFRLRSDGRRRMHACRSCDRLAAASYRTSASGRASQRAASSRYRRVHPDRHGTLRLLSKVLPRWEELDLWRCIYCAQPFEEVDHLVPRARGGDDSPGNLVPSCAACNRGPGGKFDRDADEWFLSRSTGPLLL